MAKNESLTAKVQIGKVESIDDPTFSGRIKVRVEGLHDNIPTESLPWCNYAGGCSYNQISIPNVGDHVRVKFAQDDVNSMEWYAFTHIDTELSQELASDYPGSHTLLFDYSQDVTVKYQRNSGLVLYYKGSYVQLQPDNTITIQLGPDATSGVTIQLTDGKIYMSASQQINITSGNEINLHGQSITLDGLQGVRLKGDTPNTCAVNGVELVTLLQLLAQIIDTKLGASPAGMASAAVDAAKASLLNQKISQLGDELKVEAQEQTGNTEPITGATTV